MLSLGLFLQPITSKSTIQKETESHVSLALLQQGGGWALVVFFPFYGEDSRDPGHHSLSWSSSSLPSAWQAMTSVLNSCWQLDMADSLSITSQGANHVNSAPGGISHEWADIFSIWRNVTFDRQKSEAPGSLFLEAEALETIRILALMRDEPREKKVTWNRPHNPGYTAPHSPVCYRSQVWMTFVSFYCGSPILMFTKPQGMGAMYIRVQSYTPVIVSIL